MKQFLLPLPPDADGRVRLGGDDFHYLVRVRRLRPGAECAALLPSGEGARLRVESLDGGELLARVFPEGAGEAGLAGPPIVLYQGLPKGAKMDLIVRQAAECGVAEVVAFSAQRSQPERPRTARWERIIREARQQSGSARPTRAGPLLSEEEALAHWGALKAGCRAPVGLLLAEPDLASAGEGGAAFTRGAFHRYLGGECEAVALLVGPEGGFEREEARRFLEAGFAAVSLGDTVLRVETAALCAIAAARSALLERETWIPANMNSESRRCVRGSSF